MPKTYVPVEIELGSGKKAAFNIRSDVAEYFGIDPMTATASAPKLRIRKAHTRQLYANGLGDTTSGTTTNVPKAEWYVVANPISELGSGKAIRVPTKLTTTKGNIRFATIRVPAGASMLAIAQWLKAKCDTTKLPAYFLTPSGQRHPTNITPVSDPNPGNAVADAPTTP